MSDPVDLKAPERKARGKAPPMTAAQRPNWAGRIALFALFAAIGAGAVYMTMPMLMKSPEGGAPGGAPAAGGPGDMAAMQMPVEAATVERRAMMESITVTASLRAQEQAAIRAEVMGRITEIPFTEGQPVKKGDVLFKMDDSVQKASLSQAQADVSLWSNNVKRYKELNNTRAVARVQVEEAQAQLNTANANVALARANLAKTTIRAPFDGVAGIRNASVGDVVDGTRELVIVTQTTPLRVIFDLPEKFLQAVAQDQIVKFTVESRPNQTFEATVNAIDSAIDPTTRGVRVQASADNSDGALVAGQFATLTFALSSQTEALVVPDSAIVPEGGQFTVFKIGADEAVQKTSVRIGLRDGTYAEILQGLAPGDKVVTAGQQKLFPGMKVKAMPSEAVTIKPQPNAEAPVNLPPVEAAPAETDAAVPATEELTEQPAAAEPAASETAH